MLKLFCYIVHATFKVQFIFHLQFSVNITFAKTQTNKLKSINVWL